ncbi:MAG TPA: hypothetical protein PLK77_08970 [Pyrinomonadaceae bacterium]|nr:hypothetical protein [Pyrinomonadaceae bacterium]
MESYGAHGVDNKVLVKSGILTGGATGQVAGVRDAKGNIVVTFDPSQFSSSAQAMTQGEINSFAALVGHEGAHVEQFGKSMSIYEREFQADLTQSLLIEMSSPRGHPSGWNGKPLPGEGAHTIMNGQGTLWNTDWNYAGSIVPINPQGKLDANTSKGDELRRASIDALLAVPKSKGGLYEVSKACPNTMNPCK